MIRRRAPRAEAAGLLLFGSATAAVSAWAAQALVARLLGPGAFAEFMSAWGIVFFLVAMLQGVQQEVVRSQTAGEVRCAEVASLITPGRLLLASGLAVVGWLVLSAVAGTAVNGSPLALGLVLTLGVPALVAHQVFNGLLAGSHMWGYYAASISAEAVGRALVVLAVVISGSAALGQTAAVALGGAGWVTLFLNGRVRRALVLARNLDVETVIRNARGALVATASGALVINAFPLLLQVAGDARGSASAGVIIAAVVLTRAPLLMPLYSVQGLVIGVFTRAASVLPTFARVVSVTAAITAVGCMLAALVGPAVMSLLFGDVYRVDAGFLAGLVAAAGLTATLTIAGWAVLARGRTRSYALGWASTPVAMVLLLNLPLSLSSRAMIALLTAPVVGSLVMAASTLLEHSRSPARD